MFRKDRTRRPRRKVCQCCVDHVDTIDYKNIAALRRFVSESISVRLTSLSRELELSLFFLSALTNQNGSPAYAGDFLFA